MQHLIAKMNGLQFQDFLFNDLPLDHEINIPDDIGECLNAVQQTGWILKELIACDHNDVQMILDETKVRGILVNYYSHTNGRLM